MSVANRKNEETTKERKDLLKGNHVYHQRVPDAPQYWFEISTLIQDTIKSRSALILCRVNPKSYFSNAPR